MNGDVWRSRESDLVSKYAERVRPADDPDAEGDDEQSASSTRTEQARSSTGGRTEEIDFSYMNGPPPKDLLNYKNMEMEMGLWAKTGTGWMSVGILLVFMVLCFILTCILWIIRGSIY